MKIMKTKSILIAVIALFATTTLFAKNEKKVFNVNMHCEACQKKIEKNIAFEKGVKELLVDLNTKTVAVTYDDTKTNPENLIAGFKKIGYEATLAKSGGCCSESKNAGCAKEGDVKAECKGDKTVSEEKKCCKEGTTDKKCCSSEKAGDTKKACCKETASEEKKCCSGEKATVEQKKCCSGVESKI